MTPRCLAVVLVLAVPLLVGCSPSAKLVGTWDMQTEPVDPSGGGLGGTYVPPALLNAIKPKMNIEFKENRSCVVEAYAGGEKAMGRGKWRHVKTEKDVMVLMVKMDGLSDKESKKEYEEKEVRVRFIDHYNIETVPLPVSEESWSDVALTFKRRDF